MKDIKDRTTVCDETYLSGKERTMSNFNSVVQSVPFLRCASVFELCKPENIVSSPIQSFFTDPVVGDFKGRMRKAEKDADPEAAKQRIVEEFLPKLRAPLDTCFAKIGNRRALTDKLQPIIKALNTKTVCCLVVATPKTLTRKVKLVASSITPFAMVDNDPYDGITV
jgi:hypothetical protein